MVCGRKKRVRMEKLGRCVISIIILLVMEMYGMRDTIGSERNISPTRMPSSIPVTRQPAQKIIAVSLPPEVMESFSLTVQADFEKDGIINFTDFFLFVDSFGSEQGDSRYNIHVDVDENGKVDFDDFFLFVEQFGNDVYKQAQKIYNDPRASDEDISKTVGVISLYQTVEAFDFLVSNLERIRNDHSRSQMLHHIKDFVALDDNYFTHLVSKLDNFDQYYYKQQQAIVMVLGELGDQRAVEPLLGSGLLFKTDSDISRIPAYVAQALGKLGDVSAVGPLCEAFKTADDGTRSEIVKALGKLKDVRAVDTLIQGVSDRSIFVQLNTLDALVLLGSPAIVPLMRKSVHQDNYVQKNIHRIIMILADTHIDDFVALLDDDQFVASQSARILIKIGAHASLPLQKALAKEEDPQKRLLITEMLDAIDYKLQLVGRIEDEVGVQVNEKYFSQQEVKIIYNLLSAIPHRLVQGLTIEKKIPYSLSNVAANYNGDINIIEINENNGGEALLREHLTHEIGHAIDNNFYGSSAFIQLFGRSDKTVTYSVNDNKDGLIDFAEPYGATDYGEDFATALEAYLLDTAEQIFQASKNLSRDKDRSVYMEKMLFIMNLFSYEDSGKEYVYMYKTENNTTHRLSVEISRDEQGRIITFGPVGVRYRDGAPYNGRSWAALYDWLCDNFPR